jgi:radical SAM superfamily enzyme YgiQ (UPF0313 family)
LDNPYKIIIERGGGGGFVNKFNYDLDEIPPYDLNLVIRRDIYSKNIYNVFATTLDDTKVCDSFYFFTTRGCPGHCVFCASQTVHGHKVRYYSAGRVKADVSRFVNDFGVEKIIFYDDHFLADKERAVDILHYAKTNGYNVDLAPLAFFAIDGDTARAIKECGIDTVSITIENANPVTLSKIIHKPGNLDMAKEVIRILKENNFYITTNILTGFPGETAKSIETGFNNLVTMGFNWVNFLIAAPLPGSALYKKCKTEGLFIDSADVYKMDFATCLIKTPDFTPEFIENKVYEMNLHLNFVLNYDMANGNYSQALKMFEHILNYIIDNHAFAYYFAAKCCKKLDMPLKFQEYKARYLSIKNESDFWKHWIDFFRLDDLDD